MCLHASINYLANHVFVCTVHRLYATYYSRSKHGYHPPPPFAYASTPQQRDSRTCEPSISMPSIPSHSQRKAVDRPCSVAIYPILHQSFHVSTHFTIQPAIHPPLMYFLFSIKSIRALAEIKGFNVLCRKNGGISQFSVEDHANKLFSPVIVLDRGEERKEELERKFSLTKRQTIRRCGRLEKITR